MGEFSGRINELARRAEQDLASFKPPEQPPDEAQAMTFLRHGVGQAIGIYLEARTDGLTYIDPDEFDRLEHAMNTWLECYAACYGHDIDSSVTIREAAQALLDTRNIRSVAQILTHIPEQEHAPQGDPDG